MTNAATRARTAVAVTFALNGFAFATWVSRIPQVRADLGLGNGELGLLLLVLSAGSVGTLLGSGVLIQRWGAAEIVRVGVVLVAVGLLLAGLGVAVAGSVGLAAAGLLLYGSGVGVWDVAMNVEGAAVEQRLGRSVMPRFHAAFSLGTVAGAGVGALTLGPGVPMTWHLGGVAAVTAAVALPGTRSFLVAHAEPGVSEVRSAWRAWLEPRTLLVGLMVLSLAFTEGTANDWLVLALIDGFAMPAWAGVLGFAVFVTAMTTGRVVGPVVLDRYGRVPVLRATIGLAVVGVLLLAVPVPGLWVAGPVLWGLGASLGFPVGMSAAADDPAHAASRVAVVSAIAYTAFLAGPPLLGFLADRVGTLRALLVVAVLLVPSLLAVPSAREPEPVR